MSIAHEISKSNKILKDKSLSVKLPVHMLDEK